MIYHKKIYLELKKSSKDDITPYEYFQELGVVAEFYNYFYDRAVYHYYYYLNYRKFPLFHTSHLVLLKELLSISF